MEEYEEWKEEYAEWKEEFEEWKEEYEEWKEEYEEWKEEYVEWKEECEEWKETWSLVKCDYCHGTWIESYWLLKWIIYSYFKGLCLKLLNVICKETFWQR